MPARRVPTRSCIACRTARPKRDLVRVVRTPGGEMKIDETGRVAGRGAYLCRDAGCWTLAAERGALGRALEAAVPTELREVLRNGPSMTMEQGGARGQE
ncbi:MAG TPA: YlxR family protein [Candidatus Limnocylindrales bacterium]|nr:YlxR family protein [Candidatus Limnocylindrales bacterium]